MSRLLGRLLNDAGLPDRDIHPTSIRLHHPARLLATGGRIEEAAGMLGFASLDTAVAALGWNWTNR